MNQEKIENARKELLKIFFCWDEGLSSVEIMEKEIDNTLSQTFLSEKQNWLKELGEKLPEVSKYCCEADGCARFCIAGEQHYKDQVRELISKLKEIKNMSREGIKFSNKLLDEQLITDSQERQREISIKIKSLENEYRKLDRLIHERESKERDKTKKDRCDCGHERELHGKSFNVNYTDGACRECKCMNFMMSNP